MLSPQCVCSSPVWLVTRCTCAAVDPRACIAVLAARRKTLSRKQRAQPLTLSLNPTALTAGSDQPAAEAKSDKVPSINDLDSIFGPVLSPKSVAVHTGDKWVNFSDPSPENVTVAPRPCEKAAVAASPPAGAAGSPVAEPPRALPSPLRLEELQKKALEQPKEENAEPAAASPKDFGPGQRATPPPPPPPTYRTVVSSPGPGASSGAGSPSGTSPTTRCVPGCPRAPRLVLPPVPSPKLGGCQCPSPPLLCA